MSTPDLALACSLTVPTGTLALESEAAGYELHRESLEETATSWRRHTVNHPLVEGSYTVLAVKENISRALVVWVGAATSALLEARLKTLQDALDQLSYRLTFTEGGVSTTWSCQMADYSVRREQSYRVARTALVRAQVPTHPSPVLL